MSYHQCMFAPDDPAEDLRCENWRECGLEFEQLLYPLSGGVRYLCDPCFEREYEADRIERQAKALSAETCTQCGGELGNAGWGICASCQQGMRPD